MDPVTLIALLTAVVPALTAGAKAIFQTKKLPENTQDAVHTVLPLIIGILSSGLAAYSHGSPWYQALAIGLGSGGAASSLRDLDKNTIGIAQALVELFTRKPAPPAGGPPAS